MSLAPRNILVINVTRIGDTLLCTPALRALAERWPEAKITFLGHPNRVEVLEHLPFLAHVGGMTKHRARWQGWLSPRRYDLALVYGNDAALFRYAFRVARRVVGCRQADEAINRRLFQAPDELRAGHAVERAAGLVNALGVTVNRQRLAYVVTPAERAQADDWRVAHGVDKVRPVIGLQIASFPTKAYRDWPEAYFVELCRRVRERWPESRFLVFGGPDDLARAERLCAAVGTLVAFNLAGLPLRPTAALMEGLDAYVGVDTGPTHIMGCFDRPLIALYHCRLPAGVYGALEHPFNFSVDHPLAGGDCDETTPMSSITVDMVFARLSAALGGTELFS